MGVMVVKIKDFMGDIIKMRRSGLSYEKIAFWLAEEKNLSVSPQAVRTAFLSYQRSVVSGKDDSK